MTRTQGLEIVKVQGRMLLALLALLGASVASAKAGDKESDLLNSSVVWSISQKTALAPLSVQAAVVNYNPTYTLVLPSGEVMPLNVKPVPMRGFSKAEINDAMEDTRTIVEAAARLIYSGSNFASAVVTRDHAYAVTPDSRWLLQNNLTSFDPIRAAWDDEALKAPLKEILETQQGPAASKKSAKQRFTAVISFIADSVWESTIQAYWMHQISKSLNRRAKEFGLQVVLRGEIQFGMGKFSVMKTLPIVLSIGYNRETRTVVFRRGIRKETMSGGTAWSLSLKVEVKRYRLMADVVDAGDPRPGYGSYKGESWYPPAPPFLSGVAESGRGFQSEGFSFGINFADIIPGAYLMNTVNSFEETQRVAYSAPLPRPGEWMKMFHEQVEASKTMFESSITRGGRCEMLFKPARAM